MDAARFDRRRNALEAVNDYFAKKEKSDTLSAMNTFYDRAYSLISSEKAREAFNISAEPEAIRNEYGMNDAGQRMLMARRLVAAGVRFVTLNYGGWDMHNQITQGMRGSMPPFDQAFATLIRDLDRTGLLDETLVMVSSEFGRTPKINGNAGRDHWPKVFSVVSGRRRRQARQHLRRLERRGLGARKGRDGPARPGDDHLLPVGHHRRQGVAGPGRPSD